VTHLLDAKSIQSSWSQDQLNEPRYWPIVLVLLGDLVGIPWILSQWFAATYSSAMGAAYVAFGLVILQVPLCL
jgi:hypothetical protein